MNPLRWLMLDLLHEQEMIMDIIFGYHLDIIWMSFGKDGVSHVPWCPSHMPTGHPSPASPMPLLNHNP
jgi:hypothetical protein